MAEETKGRDSAPAKAQDTVHAKHLVLDAGALIKGSGYKLASMADHFWTIPEVIAEVRDPKARHHLDSLPFELRTRQPTEEAWKAVVAFSRKTGDYPSLSKVDLKVLALTYTIEAEEKGSTAHLRTEVAKAKPVVSGTGRRPATTQKPPADAAQSAAGAAEGGSQGEEQTVGEGEQGQQEEEVVEVHEGEDDDEEVDDETDGESHDDDDDDSDGQFDDDEDDEEVEEGEPVQPSAVEAQGPAPLPTQEAADEEGGRFDDATEEDEEGLSGGQREPAPTVVAASPAAGAGGSSTEGAQQPLAAKPAAFSWADAVKKAAVPKPPAPKVEEGPAFRVEREEEEEQRSSLEHLAGGLSLADNKPATTSSKDSAAAVTSRVLGFGGGACKPLTAAEDDLKGWVNVDNYKDPAVRSDGFALAPGASRLGAYSQLDGPLAVACVTTDFAMQNVLLQMGLQLVSVEGMAVRRVKQWARRCETCSMIIHDHDRLFCSRCGNPYLSKVSISVDHETGKTHVYLGKYYRPRTRGLTFNIPQPGKAGRYDGELLLREDQLMMGAWRQKAIRKKKEMDSMFGKDITETLGMTVRKAPSDVCYGYGRKNPNAAKGRERRGKKKRKGT